MADVRALLRQQREARRIDHPHAAYSDAGKLLCTLCREHVRTESQWEAHLDGVSHRQRLASTQRAVEGSSGEESESTIASSKRKLDDDEDHAGEAASRKRTRPDALHLTTTTTTPPLPSNGHGSAGGSSQASPMRRMSTTPSQGVEIQIPSRPTTPALHAGSASVRSSLSRQTSALAATAADPTPAPAAADATARVDEAEWAAFEADMAAVSEPYDQDAVISRSAMTAEESAAAKEAQAQAARDGTRRAKADADIEDEREEATRALEDEFDEMQELEARVRRLKEKREALLRRRGTSTAAGEVELAGGDKEREENKGVAEGDKKMAGNKEVAERNNELAPEGGEENRGAAMEDEMDGDEDEDEDDWDGFRFSTGR